MPDTDLVFTCNICGAPNALPRTAVEREGGTCCHCRSTLRLRSVAAALVARLFGGAIAPLAGFPRCPHLRGLGMSDVPVVAEAFDRSFSYTNTFYDEEPRLDIMAPVTAEHRGRYDFVVSSDVLEHVPPPYELALRHLRELLRPGGWLVLTVPLDPDAAQTDEHFPDLHDYEVVERDGRPLLLNRTADGRRQVFEELRFHEGPGSTLEMRLIAPGDLLSRLGAAGFVDIGPFDQPLAEYGIVWNDPWTWPVVARAPR